MYQWKQLLTWSVHDRVTLNHTVRKIIPVLVTSMIVYSSNLDNHFLYICRQVTYCAYCSNILIIKHVYVNVWLVLILSTPCCIFQSFKVSFCTPLYISTPFAINHKVSQCSLSTPLYISTPFAINHSLSVFSFLPHSFPSYSVIYPSLNVIFINPTVPLNTLLPMPSLFPALFPLTSMPTGQYLLHSSP